MNIELTKPIAFFDLETTGVNVTKDRIVEIAILKVFPNGNKDALTRRVNPEMEIPKEVSEIHGIYNKDVATAPTFEQLAPEVMAFIGDADMAGFNSNRFDVPLLAEEFLRVGVDFDIQNRQFVDVQTIFHKMEKRTLEAAYQFYCDKTLENAHSADADTNATYEVLLAQLDKYDELENNVDFLEKFSSFNTNVDLLGRIVLDEKGVAVFNFGKHKGKSVEKIIKHDSGYYNWMMNGEFPLYTKKVLKQIKENLAAVKE